MGEKEACVRTPITMSMQFGAVKLHERVMAKIKTGDEIADAIIADFAAKVNRNADLLDEYAAKIATLESRFAAAERDAETLAPLTAPAEAQEPYAIEAGFSNGDGTWSVLIKRLPLGLADREARIFDSEWPSKLLYAAPLPQSAPVSREAVIEECAKVICPHCRAGAAVIYHDQRGWIHGQVKGDIGGWDYCHANAIRRSIAAHPAAPGRETKRPEFFCDPSVINILTNDTPTGGNRG